MTTDLIREAIEWAEAGIPVFPCNAKKRPLTENGFYDAETDPAKVRALFEFYGNSVKMIGGRMGNGLFAVDIDLYKGGDVAAWYQARLEDGSLTETRTHKTKSGGIHLLYEAEEAPTCVPTRGVEVKGEGSYIILPGTPGYEVVQEGISEAPAPLLELLRIAATNTRGSTIAQLEGNVLSGADFHNSLTQLAAKLAAKGQDQLSIQEHLIRVLENSTAKSPGHDRHSRWLSVMADAGGELSRVAASAYRKFNDDAIMEESAELFDMEAYEQLEKNIFTQLGHPIGEDVDEELPEIRSDAWPFIGEGYFADEFHDLTDQTFTLYPIFAENETVVIFAEPKTGKTAIALTTALHISCGMDVGAFKCAEAGPCLYYAMEGSRAIRLRVEAWKKKMRDAGTELPERIPMFTIEKRQALIKDDIRKQEAAKIIAANKYSKTFGTPLKVIYIDTLTKAMSGGDQNSVEDTSNLFELVDLIRNGGVTATIVFVHHKARQGHVRGSSNIEAEPDVLLDVSKKNELVTMKIARARSIEDGAKFHFGLEGVDLGKTKQGHPLEGVVAIAMAGETTNDHMDFHDAQTLGQRRKVLTQLGESVTSEEAIEAWLHQGLIEGKKARGVETPPPVNSPAVQEALHQIVDSPAGTVYGDHVIRSVISDKKVVAFTIIRAAY